MYILVVEDDADVAMFLVTGLRDAGHVVDYTGNGHDALAIASSKYFDVMILDRNLPGGVDGAGILAALREKGVTTSAIFLSGRGELSDWVTGLQAGGDDYLVKPVSMDKLLERLESQQRHRLGGQSKLQQA